MTVTGAAPRPGTSPGGDDGSPDPVLRAALDSWAGARPVGPVTAEVLLALRGARLLLPVVVGAEHRGDGCGPGRSAATSTVLLTGRDGQRGLLAFSGLDTLQAWRPAARPVPVSSVAAARAARAEGAGTLLVDIGQDWMLPVSGRDLTALAEGLVPLALGPGRHAWALTPPDRAPE